MVQSSSLIQSFMWLFSGSGCFISSCQSDWGSACYLRHGDQRMNGQESGQSACLIEDQEPALAAECTRVRMQGLGHQHQMGLLPTDAMFWDSTMAIHALTAIQGLAK